MKEPNKIYCTKGGEGGAKYNIVGVEISVMNEPSSCLNQVIIGFNKVKSTTAIKFYLGNDNALVKPRLQNLKF